MIASPHHPAASSGNMTVRRDGASLADLLASAARGVYPRRTLRARMPKALERDLALKQQDLLLELAHDLRSPLTSVLCLAEALECGQSGDVNDRQRRHLRLIYGAALQLTNLTSDVIDLVQGSGALVADQPVPLSVAALFESLHEMVGPIAEEKHLTVRLRPPSVDQRHGHPRALGRVLLNLTTNALKFTDRGFVEIAAEEQGATRVAFAVRDSGVGMDDETLERLRSPSPMVVGQRRADPLSTRLGLAMCRRLVEAMGSELLVETEPGCGTRFHFEVDLPPV